MNNSVPFAELRRLLLDLGFSYRTCKDAGRRDALKTDLLRYNRDDLEALVGVSERIAALRSQ